MKKLIFFFVTTLILTNGCKKNDLEKVDETNVVEKKKNVEHWANYDDILDIKSKVFIDTLLFRQEISKILTPEKIVELFGSGYHNFYLALTISKDSEVHFTLNTDVSYWLNPSANINNMIFSDDIDYSLYKDKTHSTKRKNQKEILNNSIFETRFPDSSKIFKAQPGFMNGKPVRSIKLYEINSIVNKDFQIIKKWSIKEIEISKYRPQLLNPNYDKYSFSTGLPAVSVDGFESIRKSIVYPEKALKNNVAGRVIVQIFADEEGNYAGYQLLKGLGYGCDEAVIEAIKNAKFRGYPTGQRSKIIVPFEFGQPKTSPIDLAVQLFDYNPDQNIYNNMSLSIVNKNKLNRNLKQIYFIYVYIDGYLVFQNYCTGITKSVTQQAYWFRWKPNKPGSYNYVIYIDPENRLNDSNRENNTVRGTLFVE